jgi:hypothetical protein
MTMDEETDVPVSEPAQSMTADEPNSIWKTGIPAEAIQLALSQGKLFLVWILNSEDPTSSSSVSWTQVWTDETIKTFLSQHAVSIKLNQGTDDATMFLQLVQAPSTAQGVWIVFVGQLLDSFTDPPTPEEMLQRIHSALSKSQASIASSIQPQQAPSSPSTSQETPQSDTINAQLAARRAKLETAKLQHGLFPVLRIKLIYRQRSKRSSSCSSIKTIFLHRSRTTKIHNPTSKRTSSTKIRSS